MEENVGIYKITNIINNKVYIGSSIHLKERIQKHKRMLLTNKHNCKHIQSSYNKYGKEAFKFEIIETCNKDILIKKEQYWLDQFKSYNYLLGYNTRSIAENNSGFSFIMPEAAKEKLRIVGKERGKTKEFKEFMSKLHKNKIVSQKTKDKQSINNLNKKLSAATKIKIGEGLSKKILNIDTNEVYNSVGECCDKLKLSRGTFHNYMRNITKKRKYNLQYN